MTEVVNYFLTFWMYVQLLVKNH